MLKVKLVVVGPIKSGKTVLCNFLADATESSSGDYQPTQGVRIVEFESGDLSLQDKGRSSKVDVELWDCSGDYKFESCWPALAKDSQGVIFVYNPERADHSDELDKYYSYFAQQQGMKTNQCLIFAHNKTGGSRKPISKPSSAMSYIDTVSTNLEDDGESLRTGFSVYLKQLVQDLTYKQTQEEETIAGI